MSRIREFIDSKKGGSIGSLELIQESLPELEHSKSEVIRVLSSNGIPMPEQGIRSCELEAQLDAIWGAPAYSEEEE